MKLWEKNYILAMVLILLVLYGSMFFIVQYSFKMNLEKACQQGTQTGQSILYSVKCLLNEDREHRKLQLYCEALKGQGVFFAVYQGKTVIVGSLPFEISQSDKEERQIVTTEQGKHLFVSSSFSGPDGGEITVCYAEDIGELYQNHQGQVYLFLAVSGAISIFIGGILYFAMKKLYYPISNIAHELRTPLTSIQGYAQYMLFGKVSSEDVQYACARINEETGYINRIIERLLVMENIKNGKIELEKIELGELLEEIKEEYASIVIHNEMESVTGDRTLLLCLFLNLASNLGRAGGTIVITAKNREISLHNQADFLGKDMLKILNSNRAVPKDKIRGKGLGVPLCHEIVKLHGGKLRYACEKGKGVTVTITFPHGSGT